MPLLWGSKVSHHSHLTNVLKKTFFRKSVSNKCYPTVYYTPLIKCLKKTKSAKVVEKSKENRKIDCLAEFFLQLLLQGPIVSNLSIFFGLC